MGYPEFDQRLNVSAVNATNPHPPKTISPEYGINMPNCGVVNDRQKTLHGFIGRQSTFQKAHPRSSPTRFLNGILLRDLDSSVARKRSARPSFVNSMSSAVFPLVVIRARKSATSYRAGSPFKRAATSLLRSVEQTEADAPLRIALVIL